MLDLQECPKADLAIAMFVVEVLKWMIDHLDLEKLKLYQDDLFSMFNDTIVLRKKQMIEHIEFLSFLGFTEKITPLKKFERVI